MKQLKYNHKALLSLKGPGSDIVEDHDSYNIRRIMIPLAATYFCQNKSNIHIYNRFNRKINKTEHLYIFPIWEVFKKTNT